MNTDRLLLPFTHDVDVKAIGYAFRLAQSWNTILVPVALIKVPHERPSKGARLEHIQQAKDFLEVVRCELLRFHVPVEYHEVFTDNVVLSITTLTNELHCKKVIVISGEKGGVLLQLDEIIQLMGVSSPLVLISLPKKRKWLFLPKTDFVFANWIYGSWLQKQQNQIIQEQEDYVLLSKKEELQEPA